MALANQTVDDILHVLLTTALTAASLYVKNPASQAQAQVYANLAAGFVNLIDTRLQASTAKPNLPQVSAQ